MEQQAYVDFLGSWTLVMWSLAALFTFVSIFLFLTYRIRYGAQKTLKDKFDLASENEINIYLRCNFILAAAMFFYTNTVSQETVELSISWFFIRIFIGICFSTLYGYVAYLIFSYYYPKKLHKKLNNLRSTPRINENTGNKMKLLSEEEEDAYLDEGLYSKKL